MNFFKEIIIATVPDFDRQAEKLLTLDALNALFDALEKNPEQGKLIPGTGGIRKIRWKSAKNNKGKSGGLRVLYCYAKHVLILLIALYAKSEKENITHAERNELKKLLPKLIEKHMEDL